MIAARNYYYSIIIITPFAKRTQTETHTRSAHCVNGAQRSEAVAVAHAQLHKFRIAASHSNGTVFLSRSNHLEMQIVKPKVMNKTTNSFERNWCEFEQMTN